MLCGRGPTGLWWEVRMKLIRRIVAALCFLRSGLLVVAILTPCFIMPLTEVNP